MLNQNRVSFCFAPTIPTSATADLTAKIGLATTRMQFGGVRR